MATSLSFLNPHAADKIPVWLDCDVGHDDAMALILAAYHPSISLLGVSTVAGNSSLKNTTANTISVMQAAGIKGIGVYKGASRPLVKPAAYAGDIHGASGLAGTALLPEPDFATYLSEDTNAVNAMYRAIISSQVPVCVVAVGPLTNIALLISMYPQIIPKIRTLSIMGGAVALGNVTAAAEFNIHFDPEAAHIVLNSGIAHISIVPLDVTHTVLTTKNVIRRIAESVPVPRFAQLITDLLLYFSSTYGGVFGMGDGAPLHDPVAVAYLFMRNAFVERYVRVDVDCSAGHGQGRTYCDMFGRTGKPPNCWVATSVDVEQFWNTMLEALVAASKESPLKNNG
ncbi:hypothetical protein LPJ66_003686 [Kickxella alabastrina]|uniref:Uncharacterized protein n=1 Tax=Kickxella alabastrina TaxID=61397 RepID=A0ACC1ILP2_9FUNG|nr:hypothetical protein LPJ66_003686 [Kickxella alabastrina]